MTKPRRRTDMKKGKKSVRITPADRRRSVETIAREAERQSILADAAFLFACSTRNRHGQSCRRSCGKCRCSLVTSAIRRRPFKGRT